MSSPDRLNETMRERNARLAAPVTTPTPTPPLSAALDVAIFDAVAIHVGEMRAASVTQDVLDAIATLDAERAATPKCDGGCDNDGSGPWHRPTCSVWRTPAATPSASPDREALREAAQAFIDAWDRLDKDWRDHVEKVRAALAAPVPDAPGAGLRHRPVCANDDEPWPCDRLKALCAALERVPAVPDAPGAGLDVERLVPLIDEVYQRGMDAPEAAAFIAREYAADTTGTDTPTDGSAP